MDAVTRPGTDVAVVRVVPGEVVVPVGRATYRGAPVELDIVAVPPAAVPEPVVEPWKPRSEALLVQVFDPGFWRYRAHPATWLPTVRWFTVTMLTGVALSGYGSSVVFWTLTPAAWCLLRDWWLPTGPGEHRRYEDQ